MRFLSPWDSPGKNTGLGCRALLQGIFLTQGSNLRLLRLPALTGGSFTTSATWEVPSPPLPPPPWDCVGQALFLPTDRAGPPLHPCPLCSPHLTIPAGLQAAPVRPLLTVGALETGRAVADIGRVGVCASHTQAAVETRSVRTRHSAHLTPQPVEPSGTGAFEGPQGLLGTGKKTRGQHSLWVIGGLLPVQSHLPGHRGLLGEVPGPRQSLCSVFLGLPIQPHRGEALEAQRDSIPPLHLCRSNAARPVCPPWCCLRGPGLIPDPGSKPASSVKPSLGLPFSHPASNLNSVTVPLTELCFIPGSPLPPPLLPPGHSSGLASPVTPHPPNWTSEAQPRPISRKSSLMLAHPESSTHLVPPPLPAP